MKEGPRLFKAGTVSRKSVASASSVLGGKNSKEMVGSGQAYSSGIRKRSYLLSTAWAPRRRNGSTSQQVYRISARRKTDFDPDYAVRPSRESVAPAGTAW